MQDPWKVREIVNRAKSLDGYGALRQQQELLAMRYFLLVYFWLFVLVIGLITLTVFLYLVLNRFRRQLDTGKCLRVQRGKQKKRGQECMSQALFGFI